MACVAGSARLGYVAHVLSGIVALGLLAAAPPLVPPRALAPDHAYFQDTLAASELATRDVIALGSAVTRIHNAWAERQARGVPPCDDVEAGDLAARAPVFGSAYRDAVQRARAAASRLTRLVVAPVLTPLISARDRDRAERVLKTTRDHARAYGEASAWQATYVLPWTARCAPPLRPAPGLVSRAPRASAEQEAATAVVGIGGGRVCPLDVPADGAAVVVAGSSACYGPERCDCAPVPVQAGAVLAP